MTRVPARFGPADLAVVAAVNLAWGMNIIAVKATVGATAPFAAAAIRLIAVALLCAPWLRPPPGRAGALLLFGVVNGALFLWLMNTALAIAHNVGALAIAGQLSVPIAVVLGVLLLGERMRPVQAGGVALAFGGVALLVFDPRVLDDLPGMALMTGAATAWAVSSLIQRRLAGVPVPTLMGWTGLVGGAVLLPLSLATEPGVLAGLPALPPAAIGWFAFSILGATLAGQGGMAWLLGRHPVSAVLPLTLASPVVSVAAAHLVFGTPVTGLMIVGGLVALAGVLIVTLTRRLPPPVEPAP